MLGIFQLVCWPTNGRRCGVVAGVQFSTLYYFFFLFIAVLVFIFKKIIIIFCCCCSFVWRGQHFDFVLHTTSLLFYMIPISFRWVSLMLSRPCQLQSVTPLKMYIKKNSQSVTFLSALPPFNQVRHGMCFSIFFPPDANESNPFTFSNNQMIMGDAVSETAARGRARAAGPLWKNPREDMS